MEPKSQQRIQAHGMTLKQMEQLKYDQIHGSVEMMSANNTNNIKDKLFKKYEDHKIPKHEKHCYHVLMEIRSFDTRTGERKSNARVNKYVPEMYDFQVKHGGFNGYEVHILHNPTKPKVEEPKVLSLVDINGIGPATAKLLIAAGVDSIEALAVLEGLQLDTLAEELKNVSPDDMIDWKNQAKEMLVG